MTVIDLNEIYKILYYKYRNVLITTPVVNLLGNWIKRFRQENN